MRNGKIETYDIHREVAEAVQGNVHYYGQLIRFLNAFNTPARAILTEHNWLFWAWNWGFRDMRWATIILFCFLEFINNKLDIWNILILFY